MNAFDGGVGAHLQRALMVAAWLLVALLAAGTIYILSSLKYVGAGIAAANTIQVSGTGDAYSVPDIAEFSFSVVSDKPTVKAAQDDATAKANALTQYLKSAGIADADIKTIDYSVSPRYSYQNQICPEPLQGGAGGAAVSAMPVIYCPPSGNQVLTGYEVTQTTDVKVRDTSKAGDLLAGVGSRGAANVSGLNFTVDDPTAVDAQARDKAIADAKSKAQKLADELGVSLVRITAFSENQNGYQPVPMAFAATEGKGAAPSAPQISPGQNKVTDNVMITYEIR